MNIMRRQENPLEQWQKKLVEDCVGHQGGDIEDYPASFKTWLELNDATAFQTILNALTPIITELENNSPCGLPRTFGEFRGVFANLITQQDPNREVHRDPFLALKETILEDEYSFIPNIMAILSNPSAESNAFFFPLTKLDVARGLVLHLLGEKEVFTSFPSTIKNIDRAVINVHLAHQNSHDPKKKVQPLQNASQALDGRLLDVLYRDLCEYNYCSLENLEAEVLRRAKLMAAVATQMVTEMQNFYSENTGIPQPNYLGSVLTLISPFIGRATYETLRGLYIDYHAANAATEPQNNPQPESQYQALYGQGQVPANNTPDFDNAFIKAYDTVLNADVGTKLKLLNTINSNTPSGTQNPFSAFFESHPNIASFLAGTAFVGAILFAANKNLLGETLGNIVKDYIAKPISDAFQGMFK